MSHLGSYANPALGDLVLELTHAADGAPTITIASPPDRYVFERTVPVRW